MADEHWIENLRNDGCRVERDGDEYVIKPTHGGSLGVCPCCFQPFRSATQARKVADVCFPPRE
jgi:hypothetical protein